MSVLSPSSRSSRQVLILTATWLSLVAGAWAATLVDSFDDVQDSVTSGHSTTQAGAMLGGWRKLASTVGQASVDGGALRLSHGLGVAGGTQEILWGGELMTPTGLGAVDLTAGGDDAFMVGILSADEAATLRLIVGTDAANSSFVDLAIAASPQPAYYRVAYAALLGSADFSQVGSLTLNLIAGAAANAVQVDFLRTTKTSESEPLMRLTDIVLMDGDGDRRASAGDTLRYRLTIKNTGASTLTNVQVSAPAMAHASTPTNLALSPIARADAPSATSAPGEAFHTPYNTVFTTGDLLANDFLGTPAAAITSFGGGTLGGAVSTNVAGATVTTDGHTLQVNADGTLNYTPKADFTGLFTFAYRIASVAGSSTATATFAVGVRPAAVGDMYSVSGNTRLDSSLLSLGSVLANDAGDNLAITIDATGTQGDLDMNATSGQFTFDSARGFTGATMVEYTITNGFGSSTATASFNVANLVWYIDSGSVAATADGRSASPYKTLADFGAVNNASVGNPGTGSVVVLRRGSGDYVNNIATDGALKLRAGQRLIGDGWSGTFVAAAGFPLAAGSVMPAFSGTNPILHNSASGGHGIVLDTGNRIFGVTVGNTPNGYGYYGLSVDGLVVSECSKTGNGGAVNLTQGAGVVNVAFEDLSSSAATSAAINLTNLAGSFIASSGSISAPVGTAFVVSGGTATINYAGSITKNNAGRLVEIQSRTGGTVTFGGSLAQSHAGGTGIRLANNTGATIGFTGPLALNTAANAAFDATGGGTVTATDLTSTITTTTGRALQVTNTSIGIGGLKFRSISTNGAVTPAILLDTTGSAGGLVVLGSGTTGTGGVIQNTTSGSVGKGAIELRSTEHVSLAGMIISSSARSGIYGSTVNGLTLADCDVINNGTASDGSEANLRFDNLTGTCEITDCVISGASEDNIRMIATGGTLDLTVDGTTIGPNSASTGGNGLLWQATGTATAVITAQNTTYTGNRGTAFFINNVDDAQLTASVTGCTFRDNGAALAFATGGSAKLKFKVADNSEIVRSVGTAISLVADSTATSTCRIDGIIANNSIGNGVPDSGSRDTFGIALDLRGAQRTYVAITGNTVRNCDQQGLWVSSAEFGAQPGGTLDLILTGNTVGTPDDNSAFPYLFAYNVLIDARHMTTVTADISGNSVSAGLGGAEAIRVRQRDTAVFRLERLSPSPVISLDVVAGRLRADNPASPTASAAARVDPAGEFTAGTPLAPVFP